MLDMPVMTTVGALSKFCCVIDFTLVLHDS